MKPTAFLINTARGPIVDEAALIETLRNQKIAGAAIDVFDREPLPAEHPFRHLPNVLATPHLGYGSQSLYEIFYQDSVASIKGMASCKIVGHDPDRAFTYERSNESPGKNWLLDAGWPAFGHEECREMLHGSGSPIHAASWHKDTSVWI
jgi:D-isomer specific 2-hydroxyacid dehydrogenase, NAD binding domain